MKALILVSLFNFSLFLNAMPTTPAKANFPGGSEALTEFIQNNLIYPITARENAITGTVKVTFDLDHKGRISNITIKESVCPAIDAEVKRVIALMPDWVVTTDLAPRQVATMALKVQFDLDTE